MRKGPGSLSHAQTYVAWPLLTPPSRSKHISFADSFPHLQLRESVAAYEQLLSSAKGYRNALIALSGASTALAGALGECARVKGAGESGEQLMAASGLHYIVANSGQILVRGFPASI